MKCRAEMQLWAVQCRCPRLLWEAVRSHDVVTANESVQQDAAELHVAFPP